MKKCVTFLVVIVLAISLPVSAKKKPKKLKKEGRKISVTCPSQKELTKNGIQACPDTGCGSALDPLLNKQKNIDQGDPDSFDQNTDWAFLVGLDNKMPKYKGIGSDRTPLRNAGEGKMIRVVAWAIDSRPQKSRKDPKTGKLKKGESCNCGFTGVRPATTDVHIVLVDDETLKLKATANKSALKRREAQSQTAEYAPHVRVARGEAFDGALLKNLINPSKNGALHVRVTGLVMYDSEHARGPFKLLRHSDWEIHPVFRLEFCPKDKECTKNSDEGWVDINK